MPESALNQTRANRLSHTLSDFIRTSMDEQEQEAARLTLGTAGVGWIHPETMAVYPENLQNFNEISATLSLINPIRALVPENGVIYKGRPEFVTNDLLEALKRESYQQLPEAVDNYEQLLGNGGPVAIELYRSNTLREFVSSQICPVYNQNVASYLYYNYEGSRILPHVDHLTFFINVIMLIEHQYEPDQEPSKTVVYPPQGTQQQFHLEPGELLILCAAYFPHARTAIKQNESVTILSLGFNPNPRFK